jgi:hypothetical protein
MAISWPSNTITIIDEIREAIGRDIIINIPVSGIACPDPTDGLDPVTNLSINQFCPTCHGAYWIETSSGISIKAHVTWKPSEILAWVTGGKVIEGDCLAQIKYTASAYMWVREAESFIVDGKTLIKKDITLRGVPEINRIIITLAQQE